jgi:hypothetical protein
MRNFTFPLKLGRFARFSRLINRIGPVNIDSKDDIPQGLGVISVQRGG